jgi:thiamine pyrophosphate-dependent acetolactate synthase large subunit-like protein
VRPERARKSRPIVIGNAGELRWQRAVLPRALGAQGFTVRDPAELESAFQKALAADATALIDIKADKNCVTPVYDFSAGARAWSYHE